MTKGERAELRSVVRGQFKVLRSEIGQREKELLADTEHGIDDLLKAEEDKAESIAFLVLEVMRECNRKINDLLYEHGYQAKSGTEKVWVKEPTMDFGTRTKRSQLKWGAVAELNQRVAAAKVILDRQEQDLLRKLAVDALETEEARAFLDSIPTVSELVPATRLAELERALDTGPTEVDDI